MQIAGDGKGNVIHLFERECSLQRRHQKIIEEAPAANLSVALRDKIAADAVRLGKRLNYRGVGTVEFILRDGARRAYSMAIAPHVKTDVPMLELHIRHMPGGKFTDHVFGAMKEKEILRIEGPYGSFYLREGSDKPIILLASGTGFAPIKAIVQHLQHKGITRPLWLYWGGRRPQDLYQDAWIRETAASLPHLTYVPVVSDALPEDHWTGRTGFVHQAVLADHPDLSGFEVYACGAPVVVESARRDYAAAGLPAEAFYADAFTSEADKMQS